MARYCFYCGRELVSGEKCNCRTTGSAAKTQSANPSSGSGETSQAGKTAAAAGSGQTGKTGTSHAGTSAKTGHGGTAAKPGATATTPKPRKDGVFRRFFQAFNPFSTSGSSSGSPAGGAKGGYSSGKTRQQSARSRSAGSKNRQQSAYSQPKSSRPGPQSSTTPRSGGFKFDPKSILPELKRLGSYLIQPAEGIRQAVQSDSQRSALIVLFLQSLIGGIFLVILTNQPILRSLLDLSMTPVSQIVPVSRGLFVFLQGFGISLAASLLLTLVYQLALRYLFRMPVSFRRLLSGLSPSGFYSALFLLGTLLTVSASFISALMILMTGFAIAAIAQFLAMRQLSGFDDSRSLTLVAFVLIFYTGVLAMLLNLSLPVLTALLNQSAII